MSNEMSDEDKLKHLMLHFDKAARYIVEETLIKQERAHCEIEGKNPADGIDFKLEIVGAENGVKLIYTMTKSSAREVVAVRNAEVVSASDLMREALIGGGGQ